MSQERTYPLSLYLNFFLNINKKPKILSNYLKKSFGSGILNVGGSAFITFFFLPIIIRRIGIELYGIWALQFIFTGLMGVADFGLSKSLVFLLPKKKNQKEINEIFSTALLVNIAAIFLISCACGALCFFKVNVWHTKQAFNKDIATVLFLSGGYLLCISMVTNFFRAVLEAHYKIYWVNMGFFLTTSLNYLSIFMLSFFTRNIYNYICCSLIIYALILISHIVAVGWTCKVSLIAPKLKIIKEIYPVSVKFFSVDFLIASVMPLNRYLLIIFSDSAVMYGTFDLSLKISMMSNGFLTLFGTPMLSLFSGYGKEGIEEIKGLLKKATLALSCCYCIGCFVFYISGTHILFIMFKLKSNEIFWITFILISGICLKGVAEPSYRAFLALGEMRIAIKITTMTIIINLVFFILLFKLPILYRMSISIAFAFAVASITTVFASTFKLKLHPLRDSPQVQ